MRSQDCDLKGSWLVFPMVLLLLFFTLGCTNNTLSVGEGIHPPLSDDDPVISSINPDRGYVGTVVTIVGKNFGDSQTARSKAGSGVYFNGIPATTYTSWSDTKIVCLLPDYSQTGGVQVVVGDAGSNSDFTFTRLWRWRGAQFITDANTGGGEN